MLYREVLNWKQVKDCRKNILKGENRKGKQLKEKKEKLKPQVTSENLISAHTRAKLT